MALNKEQAIEAGISEKSMMYDPVRKDRSQLEFIYDLAQKAPDGTAVEIGVKEGGTVVCWGQARIGRGRTIAVDNRMTQGYAIALLDKMVKYGLRVELFEVNSWDAPDVIEDEVSFCFIDAQHGEPGFPKDIAVWPDKIAPGGIIVFHDYGVWKPNVVVKKYVDKWQCKAKWLELGQVGSLIAFERPKE